MENIGIILAAGEAKRFGSQKLLHLIDGIPVVCRTILNSLNSGLNRLVIVTGFENKAVEETIIRSFPDEKRLNFIKNPNYSKGMIASFLSGLESLESDIEDVLMILGDMPFVTEGQIDKILNSRKKDFLIIPRVNNLLTHPRVIPGARFKDFRDLGQSESGKKILKKYKNKIIELDFGMSDNFRDIDVLGDSEQNS